MVRMVRLKAPVGTKGQVVIPKPVRDQLHIRPGGSVYFDLADGRVYLEPENVDEFLEELFTAIPKRRIDPETDWGEIYYEQIAARNRPPERA